MEINLFLLLAQIQLLRFAQLLVRWFIASGAIGQERSLHNLDLPNFDVKPYTEDSLMFCPRYSSTIVFSISRPKLTEESAFVVDRLTY